MTSYKPVPSNRLCLSSWHLADPRFFRSTLPAAASTKNEKNLASILKTTIEMPQTLLMASMRMLGGHARAAAAAGDELSVPYFTAAGPDDGRTHELHPGISSRAGALCVSNFTSGNRRCTHGSVSGALQTARLERVTVRLPKAFIYVRAYPSKWGKDTYVSLHGLGALAVGT